jgi:hypothetical protein
MSNHSGQQIVILATIWQWKKVDETSMNNQKLKNSYGVQSQDVK